MTPLHLAACSGTFGDGSSLDHCDDSRAAIVSYLLKRGAKYSSKTDQEETPLHLAVRHSKADMTKRLLDSGADANSRDRLNRTPLHLAIGANAQGAFEILLRNRGTDLEATMDDGTTPLILAARHDLPELVRHLVKAEVKVNTADDQGRTALHWAASVNSSKSAKELLQNGAKKDVRDEKGQTPLFLGCREGSYQAVWYLLVSRANHKLADHMNMTPEDIAKQRHHHDIVELLTLWPLVCNSPKDIHSAIVAHFRAVRPKTTTLNRSQGTPRQRANPHGNSNTSNGKRKRKKTRAEEEAYPVMTSVTTLSPAANNVGTSCAAEPSFSPNCVPMANGLPSLGSVGISPANSATFPPVLAPNSLGIQSPPPPLGILRPEDLADLEIDGLYELDDIVPFDDPTDISLCGFPLNTTAGNVEVMDFTSDSIADLLECQRLYSVYSTPELLLQHHDSRPIVFHGRTCSSAQKAPPTPSQLASYQALANSNMYLGGGNLMQSRKDYQNNDYALHQPLQLQNQPYIRKLSPVSTFLRGYDCVSPQKPLSFFTTPPPPDSPGQWTSSSSSSPC
ncbi:neurogenic locus notch homolog protein 1-like [Montipora foliosa]|uniref:neurogenic locus notch homolog protein 1-like n=1 Tax=Montipora foliosa TaxID=591990 RepID=UPI0035F1ED81